MKQARLFSLASLSTIGLLLNGCGSLVDNDHRFEVVYSNTSTGYDPPMVKYWRDGAYVGNLQFFKPTSGPNNTPVDKSDSEGRSFNRIVYHTSVCLEFGDSVYKYKFVEPAARYSTAGFYFVVQMNGDTIFNAAPDNDPNGEAKLVASCP